MVISAITNPKIRALDELVQIIGRLKAGSKTVVQCHGVFDLLHPGHIRHLEAAKRFGDVLVVTVTGDEYVNKGPGRPAFNQSLRADSLAALQCVDFVAVNNRSTAIDAIQKLRPDFYVKGLEYRNSANDVTGNIDGEAEAVAGVGGQMRFTDDITFSSTRLLNSHFPVYSEAADAFLRRVRQNHNGEDVLARLKRLRRLRALVVGDTIIDEYHYCSPLGMSPKDVFVVTKYRESEMFAGGVLAVANHLAGFCEQVEVVTCLGGKDSMDFFARRHLKPNVKATFFRNPGRTIVKSRFLEPTFLRKMFEVCYLEEGELPRRLERRICAYLDSQLAECDIVLLTDFGHGTVNKGMIEVLSEGARFLAVNAQTNSANAGYNLITKFPRADYMCIDEPELRLAVADRVGDLPTLMAQVAKRLNCQRVSITRGAHGTITYSPEEGFCEIPVFSNKVVDTVGAGDAYLSVTAPCVADGFPMDLVGLIGNVVGSLAVQIVGNRSSVEPVSLYKSLTAMLG